MGSRFRAYATLRGSEDERQDADDYEQTDEKDHADGATDELEHLQLHMGLAIAPRSRLEAQVSRGKQEGAQFGSAQVAHASSALWELAGPEDHVSRHPAAAFPATRRAG